MRIPILFSLLFLPAAVVSAPPPELSVTDATVAELAPAAVPVVLTTNGAAVAGVAFSLDFDESRLSFDPTDGDLDGVPDAVTVDAPADFTVLARYDADDGELDPDGRPWPRRPPKPAARASTTVRPGDPRCSAAVPNGRGEVVGAVSGNPRVVVRER